MNATQTAKLTEVKAQFSKMGFSISAEGGQAEDHQADFFSPDGTYFVVATGTAKGRAVKIQTAIKLDGKTNVCYR